MLDKNMILELIEMMSHALVDDQVSVCVAVEKEFDGTRYRHRVEFIDNDSDIANMIWERYDANSLDGWVDISEQVNKYMHSFSKDFDDAIDNIMNNVLMEVR